MHRQLRHQVRQQVNKTEEPTAIIIDSQSVKTAEKRGRCTIMTEEKKLKDVSVSF